VAVRGGRQQFTAPSPPVQPAMEHPRFTQVRWSGLSAVMVGMQFFCRHLAPLEA
jgi:hypothetical protein